MKKVIPTVQACVTMIVKNDAFDSMIEQYYVTFDDWFQLNDESLLMCQNLALPFTRYLLTVTTRPLQGLVVVPSEDSLLNVQRCRNSRIFSGSVATHCGIVSFAGVHSGDGHPNCGIVGVFILHSRADCQAV